MKDILGAAGRAILEDYMRSRVLLAFDFDGTLAPLNRDRRQAFMTARTTELLTRLCVQRACVVISGRARSDVLGRLAGAGIRQVVGNHGVEPHQDMAQFETWTRRVRMALARSLRGAPGIDIEDKRYSLSVHYGQAPDPLEAEQTIRRAAQSLGEPVRLVGGKRVVNVTAPSAPNKGDAVFRLAQRERAERVIYVGDDETDEDVFRCAVPTPLLGIRVGEERSSAARYFLTEQERIVDLLELMLAAQR